MRNKDEHKQDRETSLERIVFGMGTVFGMMDGVLIRPEAPTITYFLNGLPLTLLSGCITYGMTRDFKTTSKGAALFYGGHLVGETIIQIAWHYL